MQIFCKDSSTGTGLTLTLEVASSDTIRQVKEKIVAQQTQAGQPGCMCAIRLQYGEHKELVEGRTLAAYCIQQWSTLDLRISRGRCLPTCTAPCVASAGGGPATVSASPATLPILFEDEHFVAVSKPTGLLVHPTPEARGATDTVLRRLELQLGVPKLWPVHRLDRGTSGALVLARSSAAAAALSAQWQDGSGDQDDVADRAVADGAVSKEYVALVAGATPESFESREPLTNRRIQTKAARRKKKRDRTEAEARSGSGEFDLQTISDIAKRRYVAALVALCEQAGGSASIATLAEECRAEQFGLPAGTGLRATVSEWPKLWAIRQEECTRAKGKVRVVHLLRALKGQGDDLESVDGTQQSKRQRVEQREEQEEPKRQLEGRAAVVAQAAKIERQSAHTIFRRLATSNIALDNSGVEEPKQALSLLVASLKTGRRHQIRRHLAKLRTPIVGDAEHGSGKVNRPLRGLGLQRPFLHAFRLSFEHPMGKAEGDKRVTIEAPLAADLTNFLRGAGLAEMEVAFAEEIKQSTRH